MQLIIILNLNLKLRVICRECNNEIDTSSGYPEHDLLDHYNISFKKLIERCMKCMYKTYSGYQFFRKCKVNRTGLITSVHNYIDYTDTNDSDSNDNIDINKDKDEEDLNKILNELKHNFIERLKDYIKNDLKTENLMR